MQNLELARAFVEAINNHDAVAIVALVSPAHRFIDSLGQTIPPDMLLAAWQGYFAMVPDYRIEVTEWAESPTALLGVGTASGTFTHDGALSRKNEWSTPAAWRAVVEDGKVAEWRVYADNEPTRKIMRAAGIEV